MLLCPWNCPGKNSGVGSHSLLQGIFPTQGSNLGLLHWRQILYHMSYQGNPYKGKYFMFLYWIPMPLKLRLRGDGGDTFSLTLERHSDGHRFQTVPTNSDSWYRLKKLHCFPVTFKYQLTSFLFCSVQSVSQSCLTPCIPMDCSMPGFPVRHQPTELALTHVHRVSDAIQPSYPLSSPPPPAFILSQHQGLFQWVSSSHQVARVLEFQLQHQSFQ